MSLLTLVKHLQGRHNQSSHGKGSKGISRANELLANVSSAADPIKSLRDLGVRARVVGTIRGSGNQAGTDAYKIEGAYGALIQGRDRLGRITYRFEEYPESDVEEFF